MLTPSQLIRIFATLPSPKGHCWVPLTHWLHPYHFLNGTIKCFKADFFSDLFPWLRLSYWFSAVFNVFWYQLQIFRISLLVFVLLFVSEALAIEFRAVWMRRQASYLATPQPFPPLFFNGFRCHSQRTSWWNLFFPSCGSGGWTPIIRHGGKCRYPYTPSLHS